MKIKGQPGEFAFKALVYGYRGNLGTATSWQLTDGYFLSLDEAEKQYGSNCKWPVEVYDNGTVYVADVSEYEEKDDSN